MTHIGSMTGDILASFFRKVFTERYPYTARTVPERARGKLAWDAAKCDACRFCVRDCPAHAIEFRVIDKAAKKYSFIYHEDRCIYCGQCVVSCPEGALSMPNKDWHLASTSRESFVVTDGEKAENAPSKGD